THYAPHASSRPAAASAAAPAGTSSSLSPCLNIDDSKSNTATSTSDPTLPSPNVAYAYDDPNNSYLDQYQNGTPEPIIGAAGANILGPQNTPPERESADFLAPPTTDSGTVQNIKWPMAISHNRVQDRGWARQQNEHDMLIATAMVETNMRLKAGAIR
ncbi:hypothetical protein FRC11_000641, partial [Ceratobasidium sp. 423]